MSIAQETSGFRDNLAHLQTETLNSITLFVGLTGYVWLTWLLWLINSSTIPTSAWIGAGLLVISAPLSYFLRRTHLLFSTHLLVWGILGATVCAIFTGPVP